MKLINVQEEEMVVDVVKVVDLSLTVFYLKEGLGLRLGGRN